VLAKDGRTSPGTESLSYKQDGQIAVGTMYIGPKESGCFIVMTFCGKKQIIYNNWL
jgi:hypothetical protein